MTLDFSIREAHKLIKFIKGDTVTCNGIYNGELCQVVKYDNVGKMIYLRGGKGKGKEGTKCKSILDCKEELYCSKEKCTPKLLLNQRCTENFQCMTNLCLNKNNKDPHQAYKEYTNDDTHNSAANYPGFKGACKQPTNEGGQLNLFTVSINNITVNNKYIF